MKNILLNSHLDESEGISLISRGKVRDNYMFKDEFGIERILLIATDRLSAFDVVSTQGIPGKGIILNKLSTFWFEKLQNIMPLLRTHYINFSPNDLPSVLQPHREIIMERGMIAEKLQILPVECIVRGFMAGSGWKEYQEKGSICGIDLPSGIKLSDKLPHPIFTPSTKAKDGEHDINIHPREIFDILKDWARDNETLKGINVAIVSNQVEKTSLDIYQFAKNYARNRGIFIADTKFEFGIKPGTLKVTLADEILTADSSRFWDINKYCPGRAQDSMDKQPIRDYLESIGWDKVAPMPVLPEEIITETTKKYQELLRLLTI